MLQLHLIQLNFFYVFLPIYIGHEFFDQPKQVYLNKKIKKKHYHIVKHTYKFYCKCKNKYVLPIIIAGTAIPATKAIPTGAPTNVPNCHNNFFLRDHGFLPQNVHPDGLYKS